MSLPSLSPSYYTTISSLSLLAAIILSLAYSRFRGLFGQDNKNMSLTVKWGRERFVYSISVPLPPDPHTHSLQIPLPPLDTKLAALRQSLSEHTHLAPNAFKLIYAGAIMKDDDAPCEFSQ